MTNGEVVAIDGKTLRRSFLKAQSGRSDLDFDDWMLLDLRYVDEWSLWLDLTVLLRTIPVVLLRRGAR